MNIDDNEGVGGVKRRRESDSEDSKQRVFKRGGSMIVKNDDETDEDDEDYFVDEKKADMVKEKLLDGFRGSISEQILKNDSGNNKLVDSVSGSISEVSPKDSDVSALDSEQQVNDGCAKDDNGNEKLADSFRGLVSKQEVKDEHVKEDSGNKKSMDSFKGSTSEVGDNVDDGDDDDDDMMEDENGVNVEKVKPILRKSDLGSTSDSHLSKTRFDECPISPLSLKAIKEIGYEKMTIVQEATLPVILKGKDVLAKAKTGTGKTVAFLVPSIEASLNCSIFGSIQVLVICPTRELATQAASEAKKLLKYHSSSIGVQVVIGGTNFNQEKIRLKENPCQILVATPGRFIDHVENTVGFSTRLMGVKVLVLDEADNLLDMGFRKPIEKIIACVPKQRQTLLFSATVSEEVHGICNMALKRDHEYINTVQEGEETHAQISQSYILAPFDNHFSLLYVLLKEHIADDVEYKVIVFCTTAMVTKLVANLLDELNLNVREIHSRKTQSYRTRVSDEFRESKGLILVTSDVSARGVDYPDVTLVIQMGVSSDKEQYIHRLGRTGREGKVGQGILLLAPCEKYFLTTLKDLPLSKAEIPLVDPDTEKKVERGLSQVDMKTKESAFQAWLGYYYSNKIVGRYKTKLVQLANKFSRSMGLDTPPAIPRRVIGRMGLKNVPGVRSE